MDTYRQDVRYAFRRLLKSPGFTVVAALTLALGIGANTAIFSVVHGILLKPLPYYEPERLVGIFHVSDGRRTTMSGPNFTDVRRLSETLADAAAISRTRVILTGEGEPVRLDATQVSASLFDVLGVQPSFGRSFRADENQPGKTHVAVLSDGLWQQRFGADPQVIGRTITLDGVSTEVIGIMPRGFSYPANRALWTPLEYTNEFTTTQRGSWYLQAVGRAKRGDSARARHGRSADDRQAARGSISGHEPGGGFHGDLAARGDGGRLPQSGAGAAGGCRVRAAHRVCERRESSAGSCRGARGRNRGARGARRGAQPPRPPAPHRKRDAERHRRRLRSARGGVGSRSARRARTPGATPDYFRTIGIPLKRGRPFTDDDREGTTPVVLLTEAAVQRYFPGEEPIGRKITLGWGRGRNRPRAGGEVIGIIGDVKDAGLAEADPPQLYLPYRQWPVQSMSLVVKTSLPAASVSDSARVAVYAVDPNIPIANIRTLEEVVARSISQPRFYMTLLAVFAGVALVLAAIGIFGVLSYAVVQRTREIGIRMALGASQSTVLALVVRDAMMLAAAGAILGVGAALFLSDTLTTLLFDTSPKDWRTFAAVAGLLTLVALVASYVPARRAARVDPVVALRAE